VIIRLIRNENDRPSYLVEALYDLKRLAVASDESAEWIGEAVASLNLGERDAEHVWLSATVLEEHGPPDPQWHLNFKSMIDYAARNGWVSEVGWVRAHIIPPT
jgi:hypothetical protein